MTTQFTEYEARADSPRWKENANDKAPNQQNESQSENSGTPIASAKEDVKASIGSSMALTSHQPVNMMPSTDSRVKYMTSDFLDFANGYLVDLKRTIDELPMGDLQTLYSKVLSVASSDSTVHFIGNGGSRNSITQRRGLVQRARTQDYITFR